MPHGTVERSWWRPVITSLPHRAAPRLVTARRCAAMVSVTVLTILLVGCTGGDRPGPSTAASESASAVAARSAPEDRAARSDELLSSTLDAGQPGCSAAAAVDGEVVWAGARGLANLEQGTPLTTGTRFDIASVSKQFTATAILLLSLDGTLSLQDPVSRYLPGLPGWADRVTIDQLIHHTSGIPDYLDEFTQAGITYDEPTTQQDALDALATIGELPTAPGTEFDYSNSNYLLLAEIAVTASGTALPELLQDRVFGPRGLDMVMQPGLQGPDVATGYWTINGAPAPLVVRWTQIGDGSIYTTPIQLVRWADNYRTGQLGGPELLDAATADAVQTGTEPGRGRYGAGIDITPDGALGHPGQWAGFVTFMTTSNDRHTTVAASCNNQDLTDWPTLAGRLQSIWYD